MATSPFGNFANLSSARNFVDARRAAAQNPLDAFLSGGQQGLQLQQLPQQLQDQALARQLNNALLQQKLQDLQNPDAALQRKIQEVLVPKLALDLATGKGGVESPEPGMQGITVGQPNAISSQQENDLYKNQAIADLTGQKLSGSEIPSVAPNGAVIPIPGAGNLYNFNPVKEANQNADELNMALQKINAAHPVTYNVIPTSQGLVRVPKTGENAQATPLTLGDQALKAPEKAIPGSFTTINTAQGIMKRDNHTGALTPATLEEVNAATGETTQTPLMPFVKPGTPIEANKDNIASNAQDILEGRNTLYNIKQTMGRSNQAASFMESLRNEIKKFDPKFDFVASDAGGKAVSTPYYQRSLVAINAVLPNVDKLIQLQSQVPNGDIKALNSLIQKGGLQFGSTKIASLKQAQRLIGDELGLALGNGNVSDMKLQLGLDATDTTLPEEAFAASLGIVKEFLNNRKTALTDLRYASPTVQKPVGGTITPEAAQSFLKQAGGDKNKAKDLARKAGYNF